MADPVVKVRDATTGEVKLVTRGEAAQGYAGGVYQLERAQPVNLIDDAGDIYAFEQGNVRDALKAGYRIASDSEIDADFERQRLTTPLEQAKTVGEAAIRGPTLGYLGSPFSTPEAEAARRAANPDLAASVELGTGVAASLAAPLLEGGLLLGGGANLGARALSTAARLSPAGLAARAGVALESATGRALVGAAPSAARQILGRAGSVGIAGGLEGALANVGATVHESQLTDADLTAESIAAAAEEGALLGLGSGFLLGGAGTSLARGGRALGAAGKRGLEAARARLGREAAGELPGDAAGAAGVRGLVPEGGGAGASARTTNDLEVVIGGEAPERVQTRADILKAQAVRDNYDQIHDGRVTDMERDLREFAQSGDQIRNGRNISDKYKAQAAAIAKDPGTGSLEQLGGAARGQVDLLHETLTQLSQNQHTIVPGLDKLLGKLGESRLTIVKALEKGDRGAVMQELDIMKRALGDKAEDTGGFAGQRLRQAYKQIQGHLEEPTWYGRGATKIQRDENKLWQDKLDLTDNDRLRGMFNRTGDIRAADDFNDTVWAGDIHKFDELMQNANKAAFRTDVHRLNTYLRKSAELEKTMVQGRGGTGEELAQAERQIELANRIAARLDDAARDADFVGQAERRSKNLQALPMGGSADRAIRIASRSDVLAAAESRTNGIRTKIKSAVEGAASGAQKAITTFQNAGKATGRAGRIVGVVQGQQTGESRRARYDAAAESVKWLAANPAAVIERVGDRLGPLADHPRLASGVAMTAARGAQYLLTQMPKGNYSPAIVRPDLDKTQRVSDAEMSKWLRKVEAVENPGSVLASMANGDVTRDQMEALRAVYPKLHAAIVQASIEHVLEADKPIPYSGLLQLSIVTGQPLHPSMVPAFIAAAQAAVRGSRQPPAPGGGEPNSAPMPPSGRSAPDTAQATATKEQRLSAGA